MDSLLLNDVFRSLFDRLEGQWAGCDWPTEFGPGRLNLQAITSEQAAMMGRATSGSESSQWREAAVFLAHVERDAEAARDAALQAREEAAAGRLREALEHAGRACEIERRYHKLPSWEPLETELRRRLNGEPE